MDALLFGLVNITLGLLMVIFRRPFGVAFCRMGKWCWKGAPFEVFSKQRIEKMYDEAAAPNRFFILGGATAACGLVLSILGLVFGF